MTHPEAADGPTVLQGDAEDIAAVVAERVQKDVAEAKALILTGSTARGEATILRTPEGAEWLSDAEFLVVVGNGADPPAMFRRLKKLSDQIESDLRKTGTRVAVELTPAPERYFASIRPHLFGYELLRHGKQLFGKESYPARIPRFSPNDIPREDAWRLLSNRMVEWLEILAEPDMVSAPGQFYCLMKQYLDLTTSLSIFRGRYGDTYENRAAKAGLLAEGLPASLAEIVQEGMAEAVPLAAQFKKDPQSEAFGWFWKGETGDLRARLARSGRAWVLDRLPEIMGAVWRWELSEIAGRRIANRQDTLRALRSLYGPQDWLRSWGRILLRRRARAGATVVSRCWRLAPLGTPRGLVYAGAVQLLETAGDHDNEEVLSWVARHLPAHFGRPGEDWQALAGQCVRNWRAFLRMART